MCFAVYFARIGMISGEIYAFCNRFRPRLTRITKTVHPLARRNYWSNVEEKGVNECTVIAITVMSITISQRNNYLFCKQAKSRKSIILMAFLT